MKFRLVEVLEQPFLKTLELEYDANEICADEDKGKVSGTVKISLSPSDIMESIWDFMTEDRHNPPLTEEEFEVFSEDDDAYEQYIKDNFDTLFDKYEDNFYDKFQNVAVDKLERNWDRYADEDSEPYSQREEDRREFWRNVWN